MESTQPDTSRGDLLIALALSLLVNLGYLFIGPGDQRLILLLIFSTLGGLIMLAGDKSAPYGMGLILGAALAALIAVGFALGGASPLS